MASCKVWACLAALMLMMVVTEGYIVNGPGKKREKGGLGKVTWVPGNITIMQEDMDRGPVVIFAKQDGTDEFYDKNILAISTRTKFDVNAKTGQVEQLAAKRRQVEHHSLCCFHIVIATKSSQGIYFCMNAAIEPIDYAKGSKFSRKEGTTNQLNVQSQTLEPADIDDEEYAMLKHGDTQTKRIQDFIVEVEGELDNVVIALHRARMLMTPDRRYTRADADSIGVTLKEADDIMQKLRATRDDPDEKDKYSKFEDVARKITALKNQSPGYEVALRVLSAEPSN